MKYKIEDQEISLDFAGLHQFILEALNSDSKEFCIAVFNENNIQIASAIILLSGSTIQLEIPRIEDVINIDNRDSLQDKISAELQQSFIQINKDIEALSASVIEQLTDYSDLFILYPNPHSELRHFIDEHANQEYKAVFDRFSPEFAELSTESFQQRLAEFYQVFIELEKRLSTPGCDRERMFNIFKEKIAVEQKKILTVFSELKTLALLMFLHRELPKFKPALIAWEKQKQNIKDQTTEKEKEHRKAFIQKRQSELTEHFSNDERLQGYIKLTLAQYIKRFPQKYGEMTKVEIPESMIKHPGMRQKLIKLISTESLEELVFLINNQFFSKDQQLMDLYSYKKIENYSRVKPELNFKNYNLQYLSLDGFHMKDSSFEKANLANASLKNCRLFNANFAGADLANTNLSGSTLDFAQFEKANLTNASLKSCILLNANFVEADLSNTDLSGSTLDFAQWGRTIFSERTIIDWDNYGSDIILSQLKAIGQAKDLNLAQKKAEAKKCINLILPQINSNKSLLKLVELIEGKRRDFAYLREERALWRFNQYGNTKTWSTIIGQIKEQLEINVLKEHWINDEEKEIYTGAEYKTFLKIMDEHRGRGFGTVTHSKEYEHVSDDMLQNINSMRISKK